MTYDDFLKKATETGYIKEFSDYDLAVARENPDFGFSILTLKQDYRNAPTPEAKALINARANELRRQYGYTGGEAGSGYYTEGFSYPKFESQYSKTADELLGKVIDRPDFSYPEYQGRYTQTATRLLDEILNRPDFSYDPQSDPSYSAYRKQYLREGKRATEDVLGQAAAMTGGLPSSAAVTAAAQAGDYYATKLTDMLPDLYRQAYDRYLKEFSADISKLSAVRDMEDADYGRWSEERDFSYRDYLKSYDTDRSNLDAVRDMEGEDYDRWEGERDFRYRDYLDRLDMAAADEETRMARERQRISSALRIWRTYGYATREVADALGVPEGTPTSDQRYSDWSMKMRMYE